MLCGKASELLAGVDRVQSWQLNDALIKLDMDRRSTLAPAQVTGDYAMALKHEQQLAEVVWICT